MQTLKLPSSRFVFEVVFRTFIRKRVWVGGKSMIVCNTGADVTQHGGTMWLKKRSDWKTLGNQVIPKNGEEKCFCSTSFKERDDRSPLSYCTVTTRDEENVIAPTWQWEEVMTDAFAGTWQWEELMTDASATTRHWEEVMTDALAGTWLGNVWWNNFWWSRR